MLAEIGAGERTVVPVFNKVDLIDDPLVRRTALAIHPDAMLISVHTGEGIPELLARMDDLVASRDEELTLLVPHDHYDVIGRLHKEGVILEEKFLDDGVHLEIVCPARLRTLVKPFIRA